MHPVLESLRNTDKQWLIDTLYAFNGGNVEKFQGYKSSWGQQVSEGNQPGASQRETLDTLVCFTVFRPDVDSVL